ncbi:hypothetical protein ACOMHN_057567 [Nucella lapillus]
MVPTPSMGSHYLLGTGYPFCHRIVKVVSLSRRQSYTVDGIAYTSSKEREVRIIELASCSHVSEIRSEEPLMVVEVVADRSSRNDSAMMLAVPVNAWATAYRVISAQPAFVSLLVTEGTDVSTKYEKSMTSGDTSHSIVTIQVTDANLLTIQCRTNTVCKPFTGFVVHIQKNRISAFSLVPIRSAATHGENSSLDRQELSQKIDETKAAIRRDLLQDKTKMSAYIRSKTSAGDERRSCVIIGTTLGIAAVAFAFGFTVCHDFVKFVMYVKDR